MNCFSCNALKCVPMNNQECKIIRQTININSNEPLLYLYNTEINKSSCSCNYINGSYAKLYVCGFVKI